MPVKWPALVRALLAGCRISRAIQSEAAYEQVSGLKLLEGAAEKFLRATLIATSQWIIRDALAKVAKKMTGGSLPFRPANRRPINRKNIAP
jgi:hypothetical protein